jgi:hypothetical protein
LQNNKIAEELDERESSEDDDDEADDDDEELDEQNEDDDEEEEQANGEDEDGEVYLSDDEYDENEEEEPRMVCRDLLDSELCLLIVHHPQYLPISRSLSIAMFIFAHSPSLPHSLTPSLSLSLSLYECADGSRGSSSRRG